ncbi:MAG TPA: terminase endonuclease subunit [Lysobacter sp.]|nr:terminase endonuclease subunit [Lysobacter sp.]
MTLARRHYQRVTAAKVSASAAEGEPIDANAYELMLAKLAEDKRRLKEVKSIERKVEIKRQLLPEYEPWVQGVLEAGRGGQDAVLMTVMVWRIDVGHFHAALDVAEYALRHKLVLPDQYQRDAATLVAEEIADQALGALAAGAPFDPAVLDRTEQLTREHDMPDEVRAKLHKALGLACMVAAGEPPFAGEAFAHAYSARSHFLRALQLHERVGVKKELERLERGIKNSPLPASSGADTQTTVSAAPNAGAPGDSGAPAEAGSG